VRILLHIKFYFYKKIDMEQRTALIAGASGLVGRQLLSQLVADERYKRIIAISRKPLAFTSTKLETIIFDFDQENYRMDIQANDVFCCLGTTIKDAGSQDAFFKVDFGYVLKLAQWARINNIAHFSVISSLGANSASKIFYSRVKGEMENALIALDLSSLHIFRPSLLLGERDSFRFGEVLSKKLMSIFSFIFKGKLLRYKGIQASQVARIMIGQTWNDGSRLRIYESDEMQKLS
jgi:uncharacterized protein YbjT (DUF2867 family)